MKSIKTEHSITILYKLFFSVFLLSLQILNAQSTATDEEEWEISKFDFVRIETPKYVSAKNDEKIRLNNEIFQQYQKDMEISSKLKSFQGKFAQEKRIPKELPSAYFYIYKVKADSENYLNTFNGLYARFQQKQGTLATINRLSSPESVKTGMELILPIEQGLYIPEQAESALEFLLQKEYSQMISAATKKINIDGTQFVFLKDKNFSGTDIAFFRDLSMQLPLSKKVLTSPYGYRTSPISGRWTFHAGIDLAAPEGTEVYACKTGLVTTASYNSTYGNYIIVLHNEKKTSLYAHLSKILVTKNEKVTTGQVIGLVGTTGASTGPHLHFEVRENGNPTDPGKLIPDV